MQRFIPAFLAIALFMTASGLAAEDIPQTAPADPAAAQSAEPAQPSAQPAANEAYGLPLLGDKTEEGRRFLVLADPSGGEILLSVEAEPDEARLKALTTLTKALRTAEGLSMGEIRAINYADRLQVVVIPQAFLIDGKDEAASLPSGLQFFYAGGYEYDFRLRAQDRFVRIRGLYTSIADLAWIVGKASADPAAYIADTEPLALARRVDELTGSIGGLNGRIDSLEAALMASMNGGKAIRPEAIRKLKELHGAEPKLAKASALAKLKAEGLALSPKELDIAYLVLFEEK
jgi:hypothetical protein